MKKPAIVLTWLFCCSFPSHGQDWVWQNPAVTGNQLAFITKVNNSTVIATGTMSTVIQSRDRGESWAVTHTGPNAYLTDAYFVDSLYGYAVGSRMIIKTGDGGSTWTTCLPSVPYDLSAVHFLDRNVGYAAGSSGIIIKTTNGGKSWTEKRSGGITYLKSVFFLDENRGFATGRQLVIVNPRTTYYTGITIKTTDGGDSWVNVVLPNVYQDEIWTSIFFLNHEKGFIASGSGSIIQTTDSGEHWTLNSAHAGIGLYKICFLDEQRGFAYAADNILRTADGGVSWVSKRLFDGIDQTPLSLCILDEQTWIGVGTYGQIVRTDNGGVSWTAKSKGNKAWLNSIYFVDENTGYAVGGDPLKPGTILKTTNGGEIWNELDSYSAQTLESVFFLDESNGWIVGDWGTILRTENGGITWEKIESGTNYDLMSVFFSDRDTGYACGTRLYYHDNGIIMKTTDGGESWKIRSPGIKAGLNSIFFINGHTGFAVGGEDMSNGAIIKTTDGGETWTQQNVNLRYEALQSCSFPSTNVGFAVGSTAILRTTNGGESWTRFSLGQVVSLRSVSFPSENTGYIAGLDGDLFCTHDGGHSWVKQVTGAINWISSLCFINETTGWAAGQGGMILKTGHGTGTGIDLLTHSESKITLYPNPVSSTLNITVPEQALNSTLSILDLTGHLILSIEITDIQSQTDVSGLAPGIYYVRIAASSGKSIQKFIKL